MMINFLKLTSRFCGDAAQMILTTMSSFQDMEYEKVISCITVCVASVLKMPCLHCVCNTPLILQIDYWNCDSTAMAFGDNIDTAIT
jgi:hypothetical protein